MPKRPSPIHVGGPLGLAGVTLLASAVGLVVVANDTPTPAQPATGQVQSATDLRPSVGSVGVEQVQTVGDAQALPAAGSKADGGTSGSGGAEVTFIVRLKGPPEVDTICRNFKRDRDTADAAYQALSDKLPKLKDFRLVGASYSGEMNLTYKLPVGVEPTRGKIEDVRELILSIDGVAYADPDFVAHPGEDTSK